MNIGLCGNFNLRSIAAAIDSRLEGHAIVFGRDGAFHEELTACRDDFASLDLCIIALDWRELAPLVYTFTHGDEPQRAIEEFQTKCDKIKKSIGAFRSPRSIPILIFSPIIDNRNPAGFISRLLDPSPLELFFKCQNTFNALCRSMSDVYPVDVEEISAAIGKEHAYSPISNAREHEPFSSVMQSAIADRVGAILVQLRYYPLKCIVLDLDNTLWGGIVGEDGYENLELSTTGRGKAFRDFQEELFKLYKQGTFLALCSKNTTCDALDVLEKHPHMVIRPAMISCYRINWEDKPKNVVEIAKELNIGLDAILFIDDSGFERALMHAALPEVTILDLPDDPALYADALRSCTRLWPVQLTTSDAMRTCALATDGPRTNPRILSLHKEEYLKQLRITLHIALVDEDSMQRAVQLFNKTNQFNLTGARYTQGALETIAGMAGSGLFCMAMRDTSEDYGIIGVSLVNEESIESFALSCRAFGRSIERAFLIYLLMYLRKQGHTKALGRIATLPRNGMAQGFFKDAGFFLVHESTNEKLWSFDLRQPLPLIPSWIEIPPYPI